MKSLFLLPIFLISGHFLYSQTLLLNDDFEAYSQGPISSQNSGWTDLSNATADVAWAGGTFTACNSGDVNQAYLSFNSGDNIAANVGLNAVNGQLSVEMNVSLGSGFEIKLFSTDIFYQDHYEDVQADFSLKYIIDFEANVVNKYLNGGFVNSSPIQTNFNSLENIVFSNSFGNFKLGCISVTDVTDLDNDGYYADEDCNDNNPDVNPGATEVPYDGLDNDCNPSTPDDDLDGDGYFMSNDCNDNDSNVNPAATEVPYNGMDDDCNPATQDDDLDGDGYIKANDCNDNNANINPGEAEVPYNGMDDDCNPATQDDDLDGDGYIKANDCNDNNANINPGEAEVPYNGMDDDCNPATQDDDLDGDGYIKASDCNDNNANINPGEAEVPYNGLDDDCNPATLDDDLDGDGYVKANDCNDNDEDVNPGVDEVPGNGVDDNCNGQIDEVTGSRELEQEYVTVSPNPSFDYIVIKSPIEIKKVELFNSNGTKVTSSEGLLLDVSGLPSGAYYLILYNEKWETMVKRFVIQR